jgi:hypothetical protein
MNKLLSIILLSFGLQSLAYAGPFTDEMAKCLVEKTSREDKTLVIQWVYASMSFHPGVQSLANVSDARGEALNEDTANLLVDLTTVRCKEETVKALQYEGANAMEMSFALLGEAAMADLMTDQNVQAYMNGLDKYIDEEAYAKALGFDTEGQ